MLGLRRHYLAAGRLLPRPCLRRLPERMAHQRLPRHQRPPWMRVQQQQEMAGHHQPPINGIVLTSAWAVHSGRWCLCASEGSEELISSVPKVHTLGLTDLMNEAQERWPVTAQPRGVALGRLPLSKSTATAAGRAPSMHTSTTDSCCSAAVA